MDGVSENMSKLHELKLYTQLARVRGLPVPNSIVGGGWKKLAEVCGIRTDNKGVARRKLAELFLKDPHSTKKPIISTTTSLVQNAYPSSNKKKPSIDPNGSGFLQSYEWRKLRLQALKRYGRRCGCCGTVPSSDNSVRLHVDHIKPRKYFSELALDISNLQILCEDCNHGKGNWDKTDWRTPTKKAEIQVTVPRVRLRLVK